MVPPAPDASLRIHACGSALLTALPALAAGSEGDMTG